jgi:hypothetical protein
MNGIVTRGTICGFTAALALIFSPAFTAEAGATGLYSVIARAAEADVRVVVLVPDEDMYSENAVLDNRIRFTCNVDYRIAGSAPWKDRKRRGLIVTDRVIGLVTVMGKRIPQDSSAAGSTKDAPHPFTAIRRIVDKRIKHYSVPAFYCLKALAVAVRKLITVCFSVTG